MNTKKLIKDYPQYLQKVRTNIVGFDYLLFDGIDMTNERTVIAIQGGKETERTLLGLQMLYGLGQSLVEISPDCKLLEKGPFLQFLSNYQSKSYIEDQLLDIIISSSISRMTELSVSKPNWSLLSNGFSSEFFNINKVQCQDTCPGFYEKLPLADIEKRTDELICEEAIYYSNRTNSLHFRAAHTDNTEIVEPLEGYVKTNKENILFTRKFDCISQYVYTDLETHEVNKNIKELGKDLNYSFVGVDVNDACSFDLCRLFNYQITAVDICGNVPCIDNLIKIFRKDCCEKSGNKVLILIIPDSMRIPEEFVDIYIEMRSELRFDYQINSLSIRKSRTQNCALGWHQYKRRDYGIEVYPSIHNYFAQRRYLQRAMVYTHSDVVTDTYQQYLDRNRFMGKSNIRFQNFASDKQQMKEDYLRELYPTYNTGDDFMDILGKIFLTDEQYNREHSMPLRKPNDVKDLIYGFRGGVTAIVGDANTYKRFFTFGCAFSSSVSKEHTLFLLLNKEDSMIRRRLACPARSKKDKKCEECKNCYSFLHFMNISMGNITPDELIFFLRKQLEVGFKDGKKVTRVIMDDLEIIDYCFPFLRNNRLFLSALAAVCREKNISLYILCDKQGELVKELRAVSDNAICMERDNKGKLLIYIDKFAGYNNTPSKIYCGKIDKVKDLFICYDTMNEKEHLTSSFSFNTKSIEDHSVTSMDGFWNGNHDD